jgi:hypothetical protein
MVDSVWSPSENYKDRGTICKIAIFPAVVKYSETLFKTFLEKVTAKAY